ncbi:MAG: methyltransferase domain-containing protein [Chloroflexi bacterium]|nr:MAG: methyltransferase domain-containing protein [Chloroflexota bacterium]
MTQQASVSYDQVPYPGLSHSHTHPDSLATIGRLLGLQPAPVEKCRVLELGCATGSNVIPMASSLTESNFTGIDLSARQIAEGQKWIYELGLKNISLRQMDILDITPELGRFDYIIAHGVYSWVPENVREKLLSVCRQILAENGIAFISYNTYPGWHIIKVARDLMRYYSRNISDPIERVTEARSALHFFSGASPAEKSGYFSLLKSYDEFINFSENGASPKTDSALLHDELEEINQPFYFHEFIEQAEKHGLQYLGDFEHAVEEKLPKDALEVLRKKATGLIDLEQSCDFLVNRTFRKTLLVHKETSISRKLTPAKAKEFFIASHAKPAAEGFDLHSKTVVQFTDRNGSALSTDHPVSKAALLCLAEIWPRSMAFDELLSAARNQLNGSTPAQNGANENTWDTDANVLAANLLRAYGYSSELVELHVFQPRIAAHAGEYPTAIPTARYQALDGESVTNLRHERISLDGFDRFILQYLDGSSNRDRIIDALINGPAADGTLELNTEGEILDPDEKQELLKQELEFHLKWLAAASLLLDC